MPLKGDIQVKFSIPYMDKISFAHSERIKKNLRTHYNTYKMYTIRTKLVAEKSQMLLNMLNENAELH